MQAPGVHLTLMATGDEAEKYLLFLERLGARVVLEEFTGVAFADFVAEEVEHGGPSANRACTALVVSLGEGNRRSLRRLQEDEGWQLLPGGRATSLTPEAGRSSAFCSTSPGQTEVDFAWDQVHRELRRLAQEHEELGRLNRRAHEELRLRPVALSATPSATPSGSSSAFCSTGPSAGAAAPAAPPSSAAVAISATPSPEAPSLPPTPGSGVAYHPGQLSSFCPPSMKMEDHSAGS